MSGAAFDRTSLAAGVAVMLLGALLLLDQLGRIDVGFGWVAPALLAVVGTMLLAAGLEGPRRPR